VIIFSLNSLKSRINNLKSIVPIILKQCDILHINTIGYQIDKDKYDFLNNDKIVISFLESGGSETRFIHYNKYINSYYFTIDDDILYPVDYSKILIDKMAKYDNNKICCVHSSDFDLLLDSNFYQKRINYNHFTKPLKKDIKCMIPGVGTSCFYTSNFKIKINDFKIKNMSDPYISIFANIQCVEVVSIEREKLWLKPMSEGGERIFGNNPYKEIDKLVKKYLKK
jgi:hypothetical protein